MGSPTLFTNSGSSSFIPANDNVDGFDLINLGFSASVNANALTISLTTADGNTPSSGSPVYAKFRVGTLTSGNTTLATATSATNLTISAGSTLGQSSNQPEVTYVYLGNASGVLKVFVSTTNLWNEFTTQTTVAEGGAGAADSRTVLYGDAVYAGVAIRLIGRILSTQATAGTWASTPTTIGLAPSSQYIEDISEVMVNDVAGYGSTNDKIRRFNTVVVNTGSSITYTSSATNGDSFTANSVGTYAINYTDDFSGGAVAFGISLNSTQLTTSIASITAADRKALSASAGANTWGSVSCVIKMKPGDVVRAHTAGTGAGSGSGTSFFRIMRIAVP